MSSFRERAVTTDFVTKTENNSHKEKVNGIEYQVEEIKRLN